MGIFDKEKSVSRQELKSALRKDSGLIKGTIEKYSISEREKIREGFGPKYGSEISKLDYQRRIRELQNQRSRATDIHDKEKIDDEIKYLKQIGGRGF